MFKKLIWIFGIGAVIAFLCSGCSKATRTVYSDAAPVATYSVVFVDTFTEEDRQEIVDTVAIVFSAMLADYPPTVVNNTTINETTVTNTTVNNTQNIDYTVNVVGNKVTINIDGNNFLVSPGDDNECPDLYEAFCRRRHGDNHPDRPRWRNRCRQLEDECRGRNRH